jgi:hypothetical protein
LNLFLQCLLWQLFAMAVLVTDQMAAAATAVVSHAGAAHVVAMVMF